MSIGSTNVHKVMVAVIVLTSSLVLQGTQSWAEYLPSVAVQKDKNGSAHIVVNGMRTISLKTSNGPLTPFERADIVAQRLSSLATRTIEPKSIWYKTSANDSRVMIGDALLVIATQAEATAHNLNPAKLAEKWVQDLRRALSLPPLSADPQSLTVPLGENRTVTVRSLLSSTVQVEVSDPAVVSVDSSKPGTLVVTGLATGKAVIVLRAEAHRVAIDVAVKKYAARAISDTPTAVVTGWNAPASLISKTVGEAAVRSILLEPQARILSVKPAPPDRDLPPGQAMTVPVEISAGGADYIPAKLPMSVRVENRVLPSAETSWIMYSNHPERLEKYQTLFVGRLTPAGENIRLLYHHQNMMRTRVGFVVDLVNASSSPASVHVIEGVAKPILDTVVVGYLAGLDFIENQRKGIGRVIELPPNTRQSIVSQALDSPHTASGIIEFRTVSGEPPVVRVLVKPEAQRQEEDILGGVVAASSIDDSRVAFSDHIYPRPVREISVTYTVGRPWVFVRIGKEHLKHATQDMLLYGNYGVTYNIEAKVENPLDTPQTVEVAFEATAGPASGLFLLDGSLVSIKQMQSSAERTLGRFTVPAGKSRSVSIQTIPLSGSAYPATLIIRSMSGVRSVASSD